MYFVNPFLIPGVALLAADFLGWLRVNPLRLRRWRWLAIAAASGPGLAPILDYFVRPDQFSGPWPFLGVAGGYLVSFLVFTVGALDLSPSGLGLWLRRIGYLGLLLLAAIPSWVLVVLSPLVALAGIGLVRARVEAPAPS